jgi:hypothetical protein
MLDKLAANPHLLKRGEKSMSDRRALEEFFSFSQPFGSIQAVGATSPTGRNVFRSYLDRDNEVYRKLRSKRTMIVGRRGSGKTDTLLSQYFSENKRRHVIYFQDRKSASTFSRVLFHINSRITFDEPKPFVESVSMLWRSIFWILAIQKLRHDGALNDAPDNVKAIADDLLRYCNLDFDSTDPLHASVTIITSLISRFESSLNGNSASFFDHIYDIKISSFHIDDVIGKISEYIALQRRSVVILFDSFEELDITKNEHRLVLSGLLKCVGDVHSVGSPLEVKCCIPSEIYHRIIDISSNVLKDFEKQIIIHWSNIELLRMAGKRLRVFAELHYPQKDVRWIINSDLSDRSDVVEFWNRILSDTVTNGLNGFEENSIVYILRHTQLLPRQILFLFNEIFKDHLQHHDLNTPVSGKVIKSVVSKTEHLIADQVIKAYRYVWPEASSQISGVLKDLKSNVVTIGELHRAFNDAHVNHSGNIDHFQDFLRMMTELGVVGRLLRFTESYAIASYEYAEPYRLIFNQSDRLCIHPCYTMQSRLFFPGESPATYTPVYPLGSQLDDEDRRVF